jgi:hypothetical protein
MKRLFLTSVAVLFLATTLVPVSANDTEIFFKACNGRSEDKNLKICEWYIVGVLDGFATSRAVAIELNGFPDFHIFCAPKHVTTGQTIELIVAWIKNHPQDKQYTGATVIARALKDAFPCPEKSK